MEEWHVPLVLKRFSLRVYSVKRFIIIFVGCCCNLSYFYYTIAASAGLKVYLWYIEPLKGQVNSFLGSCLYSFFLKWFFLQGARNLAQ